MKMLLTSTKSKFSNKILRKWETSTSTMSSLTIIANKRRPNVTREDRDQNQGREKVTKNQGR